MKSNDSMPSISRLVKSVLDKKGDESFFLSEIFSNTINIFEFCLQIFSCSTIRVYEEVFNKDCENYRKKIKPINDILNKRFVAPSLGTIHDLARACFYLVDDSTNIELFNIKKYLDEPKLLGPIAIFLNDLNSLYEFINESDEFAARKVFNETSKKGLLPIIKEFIHFRNESSHTVNIYSVIKSKHQILRIDCDVWANAFLKIIEYTKPIITRKYQLKVLDKIYNKNETKYISINVREFFGEEVNDFNDNVSLDDWHENQWTELLNIVLEKESHNKIEYDLFPFFIMNNDNLYYYKKTQGKGYEYFDFVNHTTFLIKSRKKFNKILFNSYTSSNSQAVFWTEIIPVTNPNTKVKANIPEHGYTQFIGRKKQIINIIEEIIEIPNQNGIIFGPGGVGKTALLIELTQKLFNNSDPDNVIFDNIIWVSAKQNYYNWEQNSIIINPQQFETLANVLQIILRFFDFEGIEEYNEVDLKVFVLDVLLENRVLLVLDNFETISKAETSKIIEFFSSTVKKHLRAFPFQFKVILTSRELIPCGFYQIKLEGFELRETKMLIDSIYTKYRNSHQELTMEQCNLIQNCTFGIPIVIKHCLGQFFEFQVPLSEIFLKLAEVSNEIIKFSYKEIFTQLHKNELYIKLIILLELNNEPISARQICIVLEDDIGKINMLMQNLLNFLCVDRIYVGVEEKYKINPQVSLLSKALTKDKKEIALSLKDKINNNLTRQNRMDYGLEELEIVDIFNGYIETRDFEYGEFFITGEIKKRPNTYLLRFHHAMFLRDRKKDVVKSINLMEQIDNEIARHGKRDPNILIELIKSYLCIEPHLFEKAFNCCNELLKLNQDTEFNYLVGELYINWSTNLKNGRELDPIKYIFRKTKIKELAVAGINLLDEVRDLYQNSHVFYHLIAQGYFNQWNTDRAIFYLKKAIELSNNDLASLNRYEKFMGMIMKYV